MKSKIKIILIFILFVFLILLFNNNVYAADIPFEGNIEEKAWEAITSLPEYGNCHLYVFKYYSNYKVFFVDKVADYKCYLLVEDKVSKYGVSEWKHLYFNQPVTLNIYNVSEDGSYSKKYTDVVESSFICINPQDHGYSSTNIYTDNTYTDFYYKGYEEQEVILPYIMDTKESLTTLSGENILIDSGNLEVQELFFSIGVTVVGSDRSDIVYRTNLNNNSEFHRTGGVNGDFYEIPVSVFKNFLTSGSKVTYILTYKLSGSETSESSSISVIYGGAPENTTDNILTSNFNILHNILNSMSEEDKARAIEEANRHKEEQETQKRYPGHDKGSCKFY